MARMLAGEVFYVMNNVSKTPYPLHYVPQPRSKMSRTPFRAGLKGNVACGAYEFKKLADWKVEAQWEDSVSEKHPALCLLWDGDLEPPINGPFVDDFDIAYVVGYDPKKNYSYSVSNSEGYQHARLITKDDLFNYGYVSVQKGK